MQVAIGTSYHIYGSKYPPTFISSNGGNMMSIAYDYSRESTPVASVPRDRLLLIDGRQVSPASGRSFKSLNPATEEVIATIAEGNEADVDRAVAAARRAFEGPWRTMRAAERGNLLLKWAELLKRHADALIEIGRLEGGKAIAATTRQDCPSASDNL